MRWTGRILTHSGFTEGWGDSVNGVDPYAPKDEVLKGWCDNVDRADPHTPHEGRWGGGIIMLMWWALTHWGLTEGRDDRVDGHQHRVGNDSSYQRYHLIPPSVLRLKESVSSTLSPHPSISPQVERIRLINAITPSLHQSSGWKNPSHQRNPHPSISPQVERICLINAITPSIHQLSVCKDLFNQPYHRIPPSIYCVSLMDG